MSRRERRKAKIRNPKRLQQLRQLERVLLGGAYRTFRLSATENTLAALAKMPEAPNLNRLPGYFVVETPRGRTVENGLESVDSLIAGLIQRGFQPA